jgi:AsmA protein
MTLPRSTPWIAGLLVAPVVLAILFVATFGWNWLRGPIERMVLEKTGRELVIGGDLELSLGWPHPRLHASTVTFANSAGPEKKMVTTP